MHIYNIIFKICKEHHESKQTKNVPIFQVRLIFETKL